MVKGTPTKEALTRVAVTGESFSFALRYFYWLRRAAIQNQSVQVTSPNQYFQGGIYSNDAAVHAAHFHPASHPLTTLSRLSTQQ